MPYMTEEEADLPDEELAKNIPKVNFNKPDVYIKQRELLNVLSSTAADYIVTRSIASQKTPAQIISELVYEHIAASAVI